MPFLQLTLDIRANDPAPFEEALQAAGALSITLQDAADDPVLEPPPGATPLWPNVKLSALFDGAVDAEEVRRLLHAELPHSSVDMTFTTLADRVWEREWLKDFRPMRFGQRLWICPGGQQPPADLDLSPHPSSAPAPCIIHLDPGLAFGTGTHPTTALCLEWLDAASLQGKRIIDYGCGSGILAIAALKLGAAEALAVDIDPQALTATIDNAQRNEVLDRLTVQSVNDMQDASCDVLLANILAEPLEKLAPTLAAMVDRQGHLVLSGLLREQAERVAAHYAPWFDMAAPALHDDWVRLEGVRRSN